MAITHPAAAEPGATFAPARGLVQQEQTPAIVVAQGKHMGKPELGAHQDSNHKDQIAMDPKIETLPEKKLIGKRMRMSLSNNKTGELWRSFMPRRREIQNNLSSEFFSVQVYDQPVDPGNPSQEFDKWAAVEVADLGTIPDGMEAFVLTGGLYAVFHYTGSSTDIRIFQYIFGTWLPNSNYLLDNRPHFEILGDKYKNADPNSEEDIWIPIKPKGNA